MTRALTRNRDAPYWVHSDPTSEPVRAEQTDAVDFGRWLKMTELACPGQCNREFRRLRSRAHSELAMADATKDEPTPYVADERTVKKAVAALSQRRGPGWCDNCQAEIRAGLGRMEYLIDKCTQMAGDTGQLAPSDPVLRTGKLGKLVAPASPSPAFDMVDLLDRWPAEWATRLNTHLQLADQAQCPASYQGLLGHFAAFMAAPFAKDFGMAVHAIEKRAEHAAGVDDLVHHLPMPCLQCDRKALQRKDGAEIVQCQACRATWKWSDYDRLAVSYRVSMEGKVTA